MIIGPEYQKPHPGGPMSVQDYLWLDQSTPDAKYEYLDGVARLMSGGSVGHDKIARNVAHFIEEHFFSGPCSAFGSDVQVLIGLKPNGKEHYVYPDATVSCDVSDRQYDNKLIRSPRVVVEVLSPSTEPFDKGVKPKIYQACPTIQEIVLISQFTRHVVVYRRGKEEGAPWSYVSYDTGATVELNSVDVCLSMDEIYRGINFDKPLAE
ncbi:MAG: Uma2 family endonuclease [Chloroflexota bacterium]|nr:Uma2 family endonuclease [Chloroflexota bacterium]